MKNKTIYGDEARAKLKAGVDKVYKAIAPTLGPKGRSAILSYGEKAQSVTLDDGVSIAEFITLEDPFENEGAKLIKEVASKTNDTVGDSTTTSTVLTQSMLENALKGIAVGYNPTLIKKGMQVATREVVKSLKETALPINDFESVKKVATVSANNEEMGQIVAEAVEKVEGGLVSVEEGAEHGIHLEVVDGMQLSTGYASPYFGFKGTNNSCKLNKPLVAIIDRVISSYSEILPVLAIASKAGRSLLIVCENIQGSALATIVRNYVENRIDICVVKSPSGGANKKELLEDVAAYTGGKVFGSVFGDDIKNYNESYFGNAEVVTVDSQFTVIRANPDKAVIQERVQAIDNALIQEAKDNFRVEHLKLRRAGLTSGIALIKVCAKTSTETKAVMAKLEDAKNAALTALRGGVVAGGGTALLNCRDILENVKANYRGQDDIIFGIDVVYKALTKPLEVIAENTGLNGKTVVDNVLKSYTTTYGFDAEKETYVEDMIGAGIIDAALSSIASIENATSVVSTVIMTECLSVLVLEDFDKQVMLQQR